jgi:hypothetical protein
MRTIKATLTNAGLGLLLLPLAACSIQVEKGPGRDADVDIRTVAGSIAVHTAEDAGHTGLPVYPGAWPTHDRGDRDNADVDISTSWFGIKVAAAHYESDDSPDRVLAFYRDEMGRIGDFTECRGEVKFGRRSGRKTPVCRERHWSSEVKLVAGTEGRQRVVSVRPAPDGAEFSLVYVQTTGALLSH